MRMTAALLMGGVFLASASGLEAQEEYALSGDEVAIFNLAGNVSVVPGSGSDVVVELMRGGDDADDLEIETGTIRGKNTLRVIYPSDRVVYPRMSRGSSTDVRVNSDGTFYDGGGRSRGERVEVRGSGRGMEAFADIVVRVPAGRSIDVYLATGEAEASGLDANVHLDLGSAPATVSDIRGSVVVDTGSGRVEVDNVQGDVVNIDTGSGSVELGRIRAMELLVDTGSGSVDGGNLVAGRLNVDTGSGQIDLTGIESTDVMCDTGSGSVELEFDSDVDRLEVDTGSGSITVYLPETAGASFELDSSSGGIDIDLPVQLTRSERTYARGELGDGDGSIVLDTGSGSIRIRRR